jgi:hypothetical protein
VIPAAYKVAVAALVLAWGMLGWYAWRTETRRQNRVEAWGNRRMRLSDTPEMVYARTWEPR